MEDGKKEVRYLMLGEDGFYTFEDRWEDLPRQIGFMTQQGKMTLLGIDGLNGFTLEAPTQGNSQLDQGRPGGAL